MSCCHKKVPPSETYLLSTFVLYKFLIKIHFVYFKDCFYLIFISKLSGNALWLRCNLDVEWKSEHPNKASWARRLLSAVCNPNSFSKLDDRQQAHLWNQTVFISHPNLLLNATEHISYSYCLQARKESMLMNSRHLRYAYHNKVWFEKIEKCAHHTQNKVFLSFIDYFVQSWKHQENNEWRIMRNKIPWKYSKELLLQCVVFILKQCELYVKALCAAKPLPLLAIPSKPI